MTRSGEITKSGHGMIQISFCRPDACAKCGACEGGKKETVIWLKGNGNIGDTAIVDMPESVVASASALAYLLPLVCLLVGLLLCNVLFDGNEILMLVGGGIGLLLAMLLLKITEKKRTASPQWTPSLIDIIPKEHKGE